MHSPQELPDHAGVAFPPPFIYMGFLAFGLLLEVLLPLFIFEPGWGRFLLGLPLIVGGAILLLSAANLFRAHKTGIPPWSKSKAMVLVGPYAVTRNPMYIGMAIIYAGFALLFASLYALLLLPVVLYLIDTQVIVREEAYLARKFGQPYSDYCQQVGRWF